MSFWKSIVDFFNEPVQAPTPKPQSKVAKKVAKKTAPVETKVTRTSKANLGKLTKLQLEKKGRELGIEIDRRKLKATLVNEVYKAQ